MRCVFKLVVMVHGFLAHLAFFFCLFLFPAHQRMCMLSGAGMFKGIIHFGPFMYMCIML